MEPHDNFTIKCECVAYRDGLKISQKKKSKYSNLTLDISGKRIVISGFVGK
jgi:hypothetical protein